MPEVVLRLLSAATHLPLTYLSLFQSHRPARIQTRRKFLQIAIVSITISLCIILLTPLVLATSHSVIRCRRTQAMSIDYYIRSDHESG